MLFIVSIEDIVFTNDPNDVAMAVKTIARVLESSYAIPVTTEISITIPYLSTTKNIDYIIADILPILQSHANSGRPIALMPGVYNKAMAIRIGD